jgi:hypothetical protein
MWSRRSKFPEARTHTHALVLVSALALLTWAPAAHGQACCAGGSAVTPARLEPHELALVGALARGGSVLGSWDAQGRTVAPPPGATEVDMEEDVFAAARVISRGQVALLVPVVETWRKLGGVSEFGGGIGDVNASARYDFTEAGMSHVVPGLAALAGVTIPTGRPADAQGIGPLGTGATGIGAWQLNFGVAVEQTFGNWLVNVTGLVAERTARTVGSGAAAVHERLAPQWTVLVATAYAFPNGWAAALSASVAIEGDATINGREAPGSAHRLPTITLSVLAPLGDVWRIQGAIYDNPPIPDLGLNQPADLGASLTVVRSFI